MTGGKDRHRIHNRGPRKVMTKKNYTDNGEITYDTESKEYTVWDETYSDIVCVTMYPKVAEAALAAYVENYL